MLKQVAVAILLLDWLGPTANAQGRKTPAGAPEAQNVSIVSTDIASPTVERMQQEQMARRFLQRQAQLRIDTAKLVELTAELKQQVDKTDVNILSLDVVKKAKEIQKLAKSVQDKMKNGD
jgi:spore coat polysaccharide biosynthesis protein SpsF (cytidylyltransferase family)